MKVKQLNWIDKEDEEIAAFAVLDDQIKYKIRPIREVDFNGLYGEIKGYTACKNNQVSPNLGFFNNIEEAKNKIQEEHERFIKGCIDEENDSNG